MTKPKALKIDVKQFKDDLQLLETYLRGLSKENLMYALALCTEIVEFHREHGNYVEETLGQRQRRQQNLEAKGSKLKMPKN